MNVKLRSFQITDVDVLIKLANNKKIWLNLRDVFPHPYSKKDAEWFVYFTKDATDKQMFAIEFEGKLAGSIGVFNQYDVYKHNVEIGYWIGEPFWNKGIATKAIELMCQFTFDELDINRIYASVFENNLASSKVLENNGFLFEGVGRKAVFKEEQFLDDYKYALLKSDYLSNQRDKKQL